MKNKIITIEQMPYHYEDIFDLEYVLDCDDWDDDESALYESKITVLLLYKRKNKTYATVGRFIRSIDWDDEHIRGVQYPKEDYSYEFDAFNRDEEIGNIILCHKDVEWGFIPLDAEAEQY